MTSGSQQRPRSLTSSCLRLSQRRRGRGGDQQVWESGAKRDCSAPCAAVPPGEPRALGKGGRAPFTARGGAAPTPPRRRGLATPERCPSVTRHKNGGGAAAPAQGSWLSISALITGTGIRVSANAVTAAPLVQGPKSFHSPTISYCFSLHVSQGYTPINALCLCIFNRWFSGIIVCVPFKHASFWLYITYLPTYLSL